MNLLDLSENERTELANELQANLQGEVRSEIFSRSLYSTDASLYQVMPFLVAIPKSLEDVQQLVSFAQKHSLSIIPRGAGTSLEGQCVGSGIQVDFSVHLNQLLSLNLEERTVTVQPGMVLEQLNLALAPHGLMFGPDVATSDRATIGGMIGNNSSGSHSLVYGKTVDHVRELQVIDRNAQLQTYGTLSAEQYLRLHREPEPDLASPQGLARIVAEKVISLAPEIVARYPHILRHVNGYCLDEMLLGAKAMGLDVPDFPGERAPLAQLAPGLSLARLMVGAEGTLGIIGSATLSLVDKPLATGLVVGMFRDRQEALEANACLLELQPTSIEILDRFLLELGRAHSDFSREMGFVQGNPGAILVIEFSVFPQELALGEQSDHRQATKLLAHKLKTAEAFLKQHGLGYASLEVTTPQVMASVWKVRKSGLPLLMGLSGSRRPAAFVEDTAVSPKRLVEYVQRFDDIMAEYGTKAACYAHASVGCLHLRPLIDMHDPQDITKIDKITKAVVELILEFGGALSGEHGDGRTHTPWLPKLFGEKIYGAFRELKQLFDPEGLFNPGDIVQEGEPHASILQDLRVQGGPHPHLLSSIEPELDWSREGSLVRAVELCSGVGVCRKLNKGLMCPTFMATRDEEHSTRGRANALRSALLGILPVQAFHSERLHELMELCLQCKGCKAECPTGVDMTRLKLEYQAQYYKRHRVPLRSWLFAHAELTAKLASSVAPLANWLGQSALWPVAAKLLGIAPSRRLPHYAGTTFEQWWRKRAKKQGNNRPRVALFVDTWANYSVPAQAQACVKILEACGYQVECADKVCCGRPALSKGLLGMARRAAETNVRLLSRYVEAKIPIVGLEPSCLLTMRDEYPRLCPGEQSEALAKNCYLLEEFLLKVGQKQPLPFKAGPSAVLVHGHCHQKAIVGMAPMHQVLALVPGLRVQEIDSGCCGMAGSFGFEAEHFELSQKIGETRLFPQVRRAKEEGIPVIACGTSCRQQIFEATGVEAMHLADFLAQRL